LVLVETKAILKSPYQTEAPNHPSMTASLDLLNQITSSTPNLVQNDSKTESETPFIPKENHTYQTVAQIAIIQSEDEHPAIGERISSGN